MHRKRYLPYIFCGLLLAGCSNFRELHKKQPTVAISLPKARVQEAPKKEIIRDSLSEQPQDFVFTRADGSEVPLNVSAEWDSINKETMTSVALDEVVIAASSSRNTAERDGKINIEFIVTVPVELQKKSWMLNLFPMLSKAGVEVDSLKELRFTGTDFRQNQEKDYQRYERFLEGIIPDTVNFYHTFVSYRSFERYLDRLYQRKDALERRKVFMNKISQRANPLLTRFDAIERRIQKMDSLLLIRSGERAEREIKMKERRYEAALKALNDTVRRINPLVLNRYKQFNQMQDRIIRRKEYFLDMLAKDSIAQENIEKRKKSEKRKDAVLSMRETEKQDSSASSKSTRKETRNKSTNKQKLEERFAFFNQRMQKQDKALYHHYRKKAYSKEEDEKVKIIKSFVSGNDTIKPVDKEKLVEKYTERYKKRRSSLPMFHYKRSLNDSTRLASNTDKSNRRKDKEEKEEKTRWEIRNKKWKEKMSKMMIEKRIERKMPDTIWFVKPSKRVRQRFEEAKFDPEAIRTYYKERYEQKSNALPRYNREVIMAKANERNVYYKKKTDKLQAEIDRINMLDSTELMKQFYDTQKIARNEARKARKGEKFHELVQFPYNPDAKLDTVIHSADMVHYLYSEKIPADENTARLKLYLTGNVVDYGKNKYELPTSDTLTYFVSSMTKFVDERPRYVRRIVTRDAEASTSVNFVFPTGKTNLDRTLGNNQAELIRVKELTKDLMTDPVYIIDSLMLHAGSSPEGDWRMNEQLAKGRAQSIREVMEGDFKQLYDSLNISLAMMIDDQGNIVKSAAKEELPNLPKLVRARWVPENWDKLSGLVVRDGEQVGHRDEILELIRSVKNPDEREAQIRRKFPKDYNYLRDKLYPELRSVDFIFSLHRRGMQKDTMYTTELDQVYMEGVELLKKRKYANALEILKPYEDMNTAIAYMSLGFDKAALRIANAQPESAEILYLQAVLEYRLGDERKAVLKFLRACEQKEQLKFRGNLDPELSTLIKKYGLFKEDDMW